ncbi:MAG: putative exonuclease [Naasia sp.]|nr:putative exonuclease [Naasia sp.]
MTARTTTLAPRGLPDVPLFDLSPEPVPAAPKPPTATHRITVDPVRQREIDAALALPPELDFDVPAGLRQQLPAVPAPAVVVAAPIVAAPVVDTPAPVVDDLFDDRPMVLDGEPDLALLEPLQPGPPEWAGAVGVFDLETTGIDTATSRIVSASVAVLDEHGVVVERKDWLADPGIEIPAGASAVHGITTERARRFGRPAGEVVAEILDAIRSVERRGLPLVVYNAPYDLTLLAQEAKRHALPPLDGNGLVVDPLVIDKALDRYRKGKRTLQYAAAFYGVRLEDAHNAGADAIAAGRVAQALAARYPVELGVELDRLHGMQSEWCRQQAASFEDYMRRTKDPDFTADGSWPCRF